ncbi:MAG: sulfotransferase [Alcanivorax sp.]|uniref:O-linked N-acetylglucosamine transferase family protein n=1 Tax=Alloalcanivorax marinus TaxID=1177169 RepID=UPI00195A4F72|nr:sulfotransferase [Alloalcanivorax marinus]MBM7332279.1 sulfotransferase [Alloalcanivorax marinus]
MSVKTRTQTRFARTQQAYQRAWRLRDFHGAEKHARALVANHPKEAYSWRALGACYIELGRPEEALSPLAEAARVAPNDAHAAYLAGTAHRALKQWDAARDQLLRALRLDGKHALAHTEYARVRLATGDVEGALENLQQARRLEPKNPFILTQTINANSAARRMNDVLEDCQRLLALDSASPQYFNLAAVKHCEMGLFEQGARYFEQALALNPDYLEAFSNRIFNAHYDPALSGEDIAALIRRWRKQFSPEQRPARAETDRDPQRPLTIGLLSAGLRSHPVGQMISSALEHLPARDFRLIAYSLNDTEDHITERLRNISAGWHRVHGYADALVEARLREDQIDILIDLSGHTDGNRLRLIAREPAPLIVKWVGGLVNTTGLDAIDYLISDSVETPAGCDEQYYEKLIRLPHDYICYLPPSYAPPVQELPARALGRITFGCLNNPAKINDVLIREWATLLHEVRDSQLLLRSAQYSDAAFRDRIWTRFEQEGIARSRILLEGPEKHIAFLDTYNRIDIALDPWPYSGGLTTCEALLMGVPVITLPGPTFAGRHAASHLVNAGLPELVVDSWDTYRARARELAGDLDTLATIRRNLRDTLKASPVCDAPRFAGHLATALRGIWQRHCQQQSPAALTFSADGAARFEDGTELTPHAGNGPSLVAASDQPGHDEDSFQFDFQGKLIVLDNGGQLLDSEAASSLLDLGAFEILVFDPLGRHAQATPSRREGLQYFANAGLGDGRPAVHYACLEPTLSATLKPLGDARVLAELPVQTVALGAIEGLPSLDWLLLDDRHDNLATLEHGGELLRQALVIQARVRLAPHHHQQSGLAGLVQAAEANGFRLYRFNNEHFHSHLPETLGADRQASELTATDMIFVPEASRMEALDADRKQRLAFLLHTVYGIRDLPFRLLNEVNPDAAKGYLHSTGLSMAKAPIENPTTFVVGCGHSGTTLVASMLGAHKNIHCIQRETYWFINNQRLEQEYPLVLAEARKEGKGMVCEKTPRHLYRIDEILERFPRARFVALVRDGRDVAWSLKKRTGSFEEGVRRWRDDNQELIAQQGRGSLHLVRYEDLIEDPESTMGAVLAFLGEPYDPAVLEFHKKDYQWFDVRDAHETDGQGEDNHMIRRAWQMNQPLHDRRGLWKGNLSDEELSHLREECGDLMEHFGYHFENERTDIDA